MIHFQSAFLEQIMIKYDKCIECGCVKNSKTNLKPSVSGNSVNKMKKYKNHYTYRYQMRLQK